MWLLAALTTLFSIGQGVAANDAAQQEAAAQKEQAKLKQNETLNLAKQKGIEGEQFKSQQALAFLASGINLSGSPLATLEETQIKTQKETQSIIDRANNQYALDISNAEKLQREGTAAIFGGVVKGASSLMTAGAF